MGLGIVAIAKIIGGGVAMAAMRFSGIVDARLFREVISHRASTGIVFDWE